MKFQVELLMADLHAEDVNIRRRAAGLLRVVSDARSIEALLHGLVDRDGWVREACVIALSEMENLDLALLIDLLKDGNEVARAEAANVLGRIANPAALQPLIGVLHDTDWWVRDRAAWALGRLKTPEVVPALLEMLNDEHPHVRDSVVWALGQTGDVSVVNSLIMMLDDTSVEVQLRAASALIRLNTRNAVHAVEIWRELQGLL